MDSCSLRYFFLAAASFFLAIISLNFTCSICLPDARALGGTVSATRILLLSAAIKNVLGPDVYVFGLDLT
jgi:hypothetical protein